MGAGSAPEVDTTGQVTKAAHGVKLILQKLGLINPYYCHLMRKIATYVYSKKKNQKQGIIFSYL